MYLIPRAMAPSIVLLGILGNAVLSLAIDISSKIDLDSNEKPALPSILSTSVLKAFVDLHQAAGPKSPEFIGKEPPRGLPVGKPKIDDFINIEKLFENKKRQEGRPLDLIYAMPSTSKPTVVNNIRIIVNGNETGSNTNACKNGIANVRVTSNPDGDGNLVTDVHLSIVTKMNQNSEIGNVPVIDGTRGSENFEEVPAFHFLEQPLPLRPHYFDNNIHQVSVQRQDSGDFEDWYHSPKIYLAPQASWRYARNLEQPSKGPETAGRAWTAKRVPTDDKIEPPLSKTKGSQE